LPARSPEAAVDTFLALLRATTACVTTQPHSVAFAPRGGAARLGVSQHGHRLLLFVLLEYVVLNDASDPRLFRVETTGYRYEILDLDQHEVLAYHWHPAGISHVRYPHMHLSSKLSEVDIRRGPVPISFAAMHLYTGIVQLEDVVQLLIEEFSIPPLMDDWTKILEANRRISSSDQA
jgi:hypothetical protein